MKFSLPIRIALNTIVLAVLIELMSLVYFLSGVGNFYHRPEYLVTMADFRQMRTENEPWGAWHVPNSVSQNVSSCFDVVYRANSYGARDRERSLSSDRPRIVALGDSFMEGYGVDVEHRLTDLLEKDLGMEVLNFGASGDVGPLQYQILYKDLASRFRHDVVLVGLLPDNDFTDNDMRSWERLSETKRRYRPYYCDIKNPSLGACYVTKPDTSRVESERWSVWAIRNALQNTWTYGLARQSKLLYERYTEIEMRQSEGYVGYSESDPDRIDAVVYSMKTLAQEAEGRPVIVIIIPRLMDLEYTATHPSSLGGLKEKLAAIPNVEVLDLAASEAFRTEPYEQYFHTCDGHWSKEGNKAAAASVAPVLRELIGALAEKKSQSLQTVPPSN